MWSYVLEVPDVDFIRPCGVVVFALSYCHLDLCCDECYVGCLQFECVPIYVSKMGPDPVEYASSVWAPLAT